MGIIDRTQVRTQLESLQKKIAAVKKAEVAKRAEFGLLTLEADVQKLQKGNVAVFKTVIGADPKSIKKAVAILKNAGVSALCFSEEEDRRFAAFAYVSQDSSAASRLRADDWVSAALEPCGGRGGGSAESAQGQAQMGIEDAMKAAAAFGLQFSTEVKGQWK